MTARKTQSVFFSTRFLLPLADRLCNSEDRGDAPSGQKGLDKSSFWIYLTEKIKRGKKEKKNEDKL